MTKRAHYFSHDGHLVPSPGLERAPILDLMCSHFVLTLAARQGARFNVKRDFSSVVGLAGRHLVWPDTVLTRLREYLVRRCVGSEAWRGHEALNHQEFMARYGAWCGPFDEATLFFFLDEYAKDQPKDLISVITVTAQCLQQALKKQSTLVEKNIDALAGLLQLNKAERALLLYGTLARYQRDMRSILVEFKVNNAAEAYAAIAEVAHVNPDELGEALRAGSRLERIGLVENLISEHNITDLADLMKVSEKLPPVLLRHYQDSAELMAVFTRLASKSHLGMDDFGYVADDAKVLSQLLQHAVTQKEPGINILLYGPPGTGKTEFAKVIAQHTGLELFEVEYSDRDGNALSGRDRYRALQIAQVFLKGSDQAVLLFDEVEDVFPRISADAARYLARSESHAVASGPSVSGKAWVNQILETNQVPTIWITNEIDQIDPAFRRRFAYHLELKSPPISARHGVLRKTLEGVTVSEDYVARLSQRKGLTPAQIRTAARFARLGAPEGIAHNEPLMEALIDRQLKNADHALGRAVATHDASQPLIPYDIAHVHLASTHPLERMIQSLAAQGHGSMCFFGPPGSGKSALAAHIAGELARPLLVKRASDLLSKYLGETEHNMAAMFREAEQEGAVLLLDEADGFLLDRRTAQRSYEVTEVNEMLQGMERYRGIFICTTNLMDRFDEAALRRFTFKLEFLALRPDQRELLFATECYGGEHSPLTVEQQAALGQLDQLCLGDFANVKRQLTLMQEPVTPDGFLRLLVQEHRLKPEVRQRRPMGFTG